MRKTDVAKLFQNSRSQAVRLPRNFVLKAIASASGGGPGSAPRTAPSKPERMVPQTR